MVRLFSTGATRDDDTLKLDYEAFFSPTVLERYSRYMDSHRRLPDGSVRNGDNWQRGIPTEAYKKSLVRHLVQAWGQWRGGANDDSGQPIDLEEALCAILFNAQGLLFEILKHEEVTTK